ncbi:MAG: transketolase [Rhodospirillales bacterium]|nr:transketolase [Rhodospirillales bacterium]
MPGHAADVVASLAALEKKVLWLSTWMVHNANHLRAHPDGLKVGGHQASCASAASLMTALYFHVLRPEDRVAVKPHASPVFHAIQYLLGNQSLENLQNFRGFGGAQSYPSRTKDADDVDFSTGSVGLGPAITVFASLAQDYVRSRRPADSNANGRMIAVVGDAEMDEGTIYESLVESWKHGVRNCWWIIDYNRQSLDGVVTDNLFRLIDRMFRATGWRVLTLKYGKRLMEAFARPGGSQLKRWINDCPNSLYAALTFQGGAAWRRRLLADIGSAPGVEPLLAAHTDDALQALMANLGGHCLETILDAFAGIDDGQPTCILAYTIKGYGLPLAGHKDNHAGLMTPEQVARLRMELGIPEGAEWSPTAGLGEEEGAIRSFLARVPFRGRASLRAAGDRVPVPERLPLTPARERSTQEAFGRILYEIAGAGGALADRIVTTSPDVTVSTNLGGWVNRRGLFAAKRQEDVFHLMQVASHQKWEASETGQHIELGIAENNLFLMLGALGLSHELFGHRLFPIGTLYDPFIARGLDALNYGLYQDSRFMVVATPSGVTLAPEGGAHQSISEPLIGLGQPGLTSFEPAFGDELAEIMRWSFEHMQAPGGGSVYLRLSTRKIAQPERAMTAALARDIAAGAYWRERPRDDAPAAIVYQGAIAPEAQAAFERLKAANTEVGLLAVTSSDRLFQDWRERGSESHVAAILGALPRTTRLVTVLDGHPATLAWLGSVGGHAVVPLGVDRFGQCGTIAELYRAFGIDSQAIATAIR